MRAQDPRGFIYADVPEWYKSLIHTIELCLANAEKGDPVAIQVATVLSKINIILCAAAGPVQNGERSVRKLDRLVDSAILITTEEGN